MMKSRISIEPSILSADFTRLGQQAKEAEDAGVEGIQIDVMDGHFVPNITFGAGVVKALRKSVSLFLDAHLMISNPQTFLEEFARSGANRIIVHQEVCKDLPAVLQSIKKLKVEGKMFDWVKVSKTKIQSLRREIDHRHLSASIVVDGGIDMKTAPLAVKSGATVLVAGSSVYNQSGSVAKNVATLRDSIAATVAAIGSD